VQVSLPKSTPGTRSKINPLSSIGNPIKQGWERCIEEEEEEEAMV